MNFGFKKQLLVLVLVLGAGLAIIFNLPAFMPDGDNAPAPFFNPTQMLFNNDNPLGAQKSEQNQEPGIMFGAWGDLTWVGGPGFSDSPRISSITSSILPTEWYVKYYPFLSMLFVGFSAWLLFRALGLNSGVSILGGFAAGINMHFFSIAAWGLNQWDIAVGSMFLALAALVTKSIKQWWAKALLAGFAVGMVIMEGFDAGAILSIYIGIFILFLGWNSEGTTATKVTRTVITGIIVVGFSALLAAHTIDELVGTSIKGVAGVEQANKATTPEQKAQAKAERWAFCTQWSLPKLETLRLFIPGLMGYHMYENVDGSDKSSAYWGAIGEDLRLGEIRELRHSPDPSVRQQADLAMKNFDGYRRHIGSGDYAGLLVMMLALFSVAASFRGAKTPYTRFERNCVWFWGSAALISLLLAFGHHAFLYRIVFELPYFSTMRNPIKFLHPFYVATAILAAYGAEAIWRSYLQNAAQRTQVLPQHVLNWWGRVAGFEKKWTLVWLAAIVVSLFGLFVLVSKKGDLEHYLSLSGVVSGTEGALATFCIGEVTCFVIFLIISVLVLTCIISGAWTGKKAKWAWIAIGVVLLCDVGRADRYWLKFYNYKQKYAMNPMLDFLRQEPYNKKSTAKLMPFGRYDISACLSPQKPYDNNFYAVCNEWLQNQFPYYNIQALDIIQAPRTPELDNSYAAAFSPRTSGELQLCARLWQLTSTRYIFCWGGFMDRPLYEGGPSLKGLDPAPNAFQVRYKLNVVPGPGVKYPTTSADLTMEPADDGEFALVEYTNALPRAKLYSNWQTGNSTETILGTLRSPGFDPQKSVIVSKETAVVAPSSPGADAGTVKIESYHPKYVKLSANANTPAVLLLNERTGPNWQVWVDDKEMPILRCNYIMRGVHVDKGQHTVEFKYREPLRSLYLTFAGWGLGILVAGFVIATNRRGQAAETNEKAKSTSEKTTSRV